MKSQSRLRLWIAAMLAYWAIGDETASANDKL
jgi:hypothetical protein